MNRPELRKRPRICYYEPEEPSFDEYIYCDECADFVYEYCAIHGSLLLIPDDKVPHTSPYPAYVPRAALTIPQTFLHLAPSIIPGAGLGVFSTLTLPRGVRFGPYCGEHTQNVESMYCWQIYDSTNKPSHVLDAANGHRSNWMRYVNCARHWREQNLLAYQYQGQLYYRTIKIIPRFTELMVFYGSEFANALNIDLSKYNKKEYYREIINSRKHFGRKIENITNASFEAINVNEKELDICDEINTGQSSLANEKFDYQGEDIIIESKEETNNAYSEDNDSVLQVKCIGDEIIINFNNNNPQEKSFKCEICLKLFTRKRNLRHHVKLHTKTYKYNCDFCDFKTDLKHRFDEHVEKHVNSYKYSCDKCFYKSNVRRNFITHSLRHGPINNVKSSRQSDIYFDVPQKCYLCDFTTLSRKKFSIHKAKHSGIVHKCDFCEYTNYMKYNLTRHIRRWHQN